MHFTSTIHSNAFSVVFEYAKVSQAYHIHDNPMMCVCMHKIKMYVCVMYLYWFFQQSSSTTENVDQKVPYRDLCKVIGPY